MPNAPKDDDATRFVDRLQLIERWPGEAIVLATSHGDGFSSFPHSHGRAQLLHAVRGVVQVSTDAGRWMVPPGHAMWIPAGTVHSVEMLGDVAMRSVYVTEGAAAGLPLGLKVFGLTDLMRDLIAEAVGLGGEPAAGRREKLVLELLVEEIAMLPERPFGLPMPSDPRLARLCRDFIARPSARATIDDWAARAGMSRRSFTRAFHRQTGLGLSAWRQQACLFAALPKLADGEAITTVALDLGYESVPAFITMFKRMLGVAPRAYLKGRVAAG